MAIGANSFEWMLECRMMELIADSSQNSKHVWKDDSHRRDMGHGATPFPTHFERCVRDSLRVCACWMCRRMIPRILHEDYWVSLIGWCCFLSHCVAVKLQHHRHAVVLASLSPDIGPPF